MSEWKPIESAPRGVTPFLVWCDEVERAWWPEGYACPFDSDGDPIANATYWMPLPEPPQ